MKQLLTILFICFLAESLTAQEQPTIQPTIMVIPFAKEGNSTRKAYEYSELNRIAITKVKEAFDQRGVNTIDFRAKLKQLQNAEALTEDQEMTLKDEVIKMSGADIYVEIEANKDRTNTGNSVTCILTAYDAFSGESLANKVSSSPKFNTENFEKLTQKAIEAEVDNLLNTIQEKFNDMVENGRTITMEVGIEIGTDFNLDTEVDDSGYYLSELIEEWVAENAHKHYFHIQGQSETKMIFDIIKVPLKDDMGRNYRISTFAADFRRHFREKGIKADRTITGSAITVTLSSL
ncbi:DUF6175 family protein [Phaeodactylibacter xiamenensis]|jgi:uncharacterized phage-associated protein|uniref:DUF6175 family protein n=1 Tax=Phaeodactylibacter xiamenensis TaxID=1524460 RepID=UPI0024A7AEFB|nr:DUF6175 family protein [Phaeodactylibacter xiamenensis]